MYKGAFVPGFVLTGMYALYVVVVALFRPHWVPALPLEARTIREDNGKSGLTSLVVLIVASVALSVCASRRTRVRPTSSTPTDETIVVSMCVGVGARLRRSRCSTSCPSSDLLSRMAERVTFVLIPPLALIFLVLGTIFLGIATPTEGGAMGAVGALADGASRRRLSMRCCKQAMDSTTKLSCFVVFILLGSTVFSLSFQAVDGRAGSSTC